jgi:hypothetical protein
MLRRSRSHGMVSLSPNTMAGDAAAGDVSPAAGTVGASILSMAACKLTDLVVPWGRIGEAV